MDWDVVNLNIETKGRYLNELKVTKGKEQPALETCIKTFVPFCLFPLIVNGKN